MGLPTAQRTVGEASTKNLTKAQPQPKTVISLDILGVGRHTSKCVGDTPLISEDSTARGNSSYFAPDAESSIDSQSGSSPGSPRKATSSTFSEDSSRVIAMPVMMTETAMIATLMNKLEVHNHGESSNGPIHQRTPQDGHKRVEDQHTNSTSIASLSVQQLHDMITNIIRAQYGDAPQREEGRKESMAIAAKPVGIFAKEKKEKRTKGPSQERERCRLTLKEMEEKTYPFPNSDVPGMLEDLLEKEVIKLPKCKRPEEMGRTNDPKYCKYHRVVSHTVEKCFVLKDLILRLAKEGKILLDLDEAVGSNHATFTFGSPSPTKT
uniref:Retrotransposon gag protein n=1 Tax=Fagus sylvatica TaxID=28930 RepID=A0A2N9FUH3_FAGSY